MKGNDNSDRAVKAANQNIKEKEFWLETLSSDPVKSRFPVDNGGIQKKNSENRKMEVESFRFSKGLSSKSIKVSSGIDLELHMILVAGLVGLLEKYTSTSDIIIGSPILKQDIEAEFFNTFLVLRIRPTAYMTFKELLLQVKETIANATKNQNFPLEVLPNLLNMPVFGNEFPLFDVALLLQNVHDKSYLEGIHYNMLFSFNRLEDGIEGSLEYNSLLYQKRTVKQIISHYTRLLEKGLYDLNVPVAHIDLLSAQEKHQLLEEFNAKKMEFPKNKTFHQLFEEQVERAGDNIAVIGRAHNSPGRTSEERTAPCSMLCTLTYRELNRQSDQFTSLLMIKGVEPGNIVGIIVEPSLGMMIGLLGILKAGGAFLPIAPGNPGERINYMLSDCDVRILVTDKLSYAVSKVSEVIDLNTYLFALSTTHPISPTHLLPHLPTQLNWQNLAYVIYTSGSTGKPKGVAISHKNLIPLFLWFGEYFHLDENTRVLQTLSYAFDFGIFEIFTTVIFGGLFYFKERMSSADFEGFLDLIELYCINTLHATPTLLKQITSLGRSFPGIRIVHFGGEVLDGVLLRDTAKLLSRDCMLYNGYGPTEATINSSIFSIRSQEVLERTGNAMIPIGKPSANNTILILDSYGRLQPIGVVGELYISGDGISRGYLNNPEQTAEKFNRDFLGYQDDQDKNEKKLLKGIGKNIPTSLPLYPSTPLYRTGDLGRWLPDGNIAFLGRVDHQVKIRGFRIELGEIESQLLAHKEIKESVVTVKESGSGDKYLCAYIVTRTSGAFDKMPGTEELREYLSEILPDYMMPSFFVPLEQLPLTSSGKVNRKALPEPEVVKGVKYAPPRDQTEEKLVELWTEVLGMEKAAIGIDDNFFALGGHSLNGAVVASGVHKTFNVRLRLSELFEMPSVRQLSAYIKEAVEERYLPLERTEEKEYYTLSSAQKRLYVLQQMDPESESYNISEITELEGELEGKRLEVTFKKLIDRHESLRTSFHMVEEEPVQKIHKKVNFKIEYNEVSNSLPASLPPLISQFIRSFDLSRAPLFRVGIIKTGRDRHILMVDMNHIISDGISLALFIDDFVMLYEGESLPELQLQYRDYSQWQNNQLDSGELEAQENYWLQEFKGELPSLNMPLDYPRPSVQSFEGDTVTFDAGTELTKQLKRLSSETGITLYMVLLAAYALLLFKYTESETIVVGSPVAGRPHADLGNIIGMFVNTIAIKIHLDYEKSFKEILAIVKEKSMEALKNQDYPFEMLVDKLNNKRDAGRNPLFDTLFVLQNLEISKIKIKNLKTIPYEYKSKTSPFDFWVEGVEREDDIAFFMGYCTKLFKRETMERLGRHFINILNQVIEKSDVSVSEIDLVSEYEKNQILSSINTTREGEEYDLI